MPGPKPPQIVLSEDQRMVLENLVRAQKTGQALARRARVVLLAALGYSNMDIARQAAESGCGGGAGPSGAPFRWRS